MRFAFWCRHSITDSNELVARASECPYVKRMALLRTGSHSRAFLNLVARKTPADLQADMLAQGEWTPAKATDWEKLTTDSASVRGWEIVRDETLARRRASAASALEQIEQPLDLLLQVAGQKRRSAIRKPQKARPSRAAGGKSGRKHGSYKILYNNDGTVKRLSTVERARGGAVDASSETS